jgi:hypothetical protein
MVTAVGLAIILPKTTGRMMQTIAIMSRLLRREVRNVEEMMMRGVWVCLLVQ